MNLSLYFIFYPNFKDLIVVLSSLEPSESAFELRLELSLYFVTCFLFRFDFLHFAFHFFFCFLVSKLKMLHRIPFWAERFLPVFGTAIVIRLQAQHKKLYTRPAEKRILWPRREAGRATRRMRDMRDAGNVNRNQSNCWFALVCKAACVCVCVSVCIRVCLCLCLCLSMKLETAAVAATN